jgi:hypothetical protein
MSNPIIKLDDFLEKPLWDALHAYFKRTPWHYGHFADKAISEFSHWHIDYLNKPGSSTENYEHILYGNPQFKLIADVWDVLKAFHLKGHSLVRCYANAHTYGVEGAPHTDSRLANNFTTIIYVNPSWKTEWAGETTFFNEAGDTVDAVLPKPNRIITFDGTQVHSARALSRLCPELRMTLMFKTIAPTTESSAV